MGNKYKVGDKVYLPSGVGFYGPLEDKYGYVTRVDEHNVHHTILDDYGEPIPINFEHDPENDWDIEWCTGIHYNPQLVNVTTQVGVIKHLKKHKLYETKEVSY